MIKSETIEKEDVPVVWEDQEKINEFSCLVVETREISDQIIHCKEQVQQLKDAEEELLVCINPDVSLLKIGETFYKETESTIQKTIQRLIQEKEEEILQKQNEKAHLEDQMKQLKALLYAKFGSKRINLDTQ